VEATHLAFWLGLGFCGSTFGCGRWVAELLPMDLGVDLAGFMACDRQVALHVSGWIDVVPLDDFSVPDVHDLTLFFVASGTTEPLRLKVANILAEHYLLCDWDIIPVMLLDWAVAFDKCTWGHGNPSELGFLACASFTTHEPFGKWVTGVLNHGYSTVELVGETDLVLLFEFFFDFLHFLFSVL
jgi:hypothetical protein